MPPELTPSHGGPVAVSSIFPLEFDTYRLPGSTFSAYSWSSGQALVQVIEGEPGIRQINFLFTEAGALRFTDHASSVFLQFSEPDGVCNVMGRAAEGEVFEGVPGVVYSRLEVYFPNTTLRLMAGHFMGLGKLLGRAAVGGAGSLGAVDRPITAAMYGSLKELFRSDLSAELGTMYRKERAMELLFAVLELFS